MRSCSMHAWVSEPGGMMLNPSLICIDKYSTRNVIFYKRNDMIGLTHDTIEYTHDRTRLTRDTIGLIYDRIG